MMSAIHTRLANIDDIPTLAILFDEYRQFYEQPSDLTKAQAFLTKRFQHNESIIIVAETNTGEVLGFCQLYPTFCSVIAERIAVLYDLFVNQHQRNTGAGKALMLAAKQYAIEAGLARLDLTTAKNNYPAQRLYESLGWIRDEVFYAYSLSLTRE